MCAAAMQPRKMALIIGNNSYEKGPLENCVNDANDLSNKLREIGFRVTSKINLNCELMEKEMDDFTESLGPGDFIFFFFAGHGLQWGDQNYLIPCDDRKIRETLDLKYHAINAQRFLERLSSRRPYVIVFFLDCCRDYTGPSDGRGQLTGGLAQMTAPAGSVIGFACAAGKKASDGSSSGQNGIFTKHILQRIDRPGEEVLMLLVDIANGVSNETNGVQQPYLTSSLNQRNIWFVPPTGSISSSTPFETIPIPTHVISTSNVQPGLQRRIDEQRHTHEAQFKEMSLTADDLEHLANEVERGDIHWKRLDFFNNHFGPNGCVHIRRILEVLPLTYLHLGVNHIGPQGIAHLSVLRAHRTLTELDLWDNAIGDDGVETLSQFIPHTRLQRLNLGVNLIGDKGCSTLARALPTTLTYLNLYANKISAESRTIITHLIDSRRTQLAELNLEANLISSSGSCQNEIKTTGNLNNCQVLI